MIRPILLWPDPRLSQVCAPVTGDVRALASDMLDTMYNAPGRGLAAPQIGEMQRLFVMDATWKDGDPAPVVFINPSIILSSDAVVTNPEACLSIPGAQTDVTRPAEVTLRWTDLDGAPREQTFTGFAAACVQHEYDHLDGVVTFDRMPPEAGSQAKAQYRAATGQ